MTSSTLDVHSESIYNNYMNLFGVFGFSWRAPSTVHMYIYTYTVCMNLTVSQL